MLVPSQATLNQIIVIVLSVYTPWFLFTEMGIEGNDIYSFLIYPPVSPHLSLSRVAP